MNNRFLTDEQVLDRVKAHISAKTTDRADEVWSEPVANYTCAARFDEEKSLVLQTGPLLLCHISYVSEPGSYFTTELLGVPVVVVRARDGEIRAFKNVCRHRGKKVAQGSGCARSFSCGYHGWTYNLVGDLIHIPHQDGFPDTDKAKNGLVPLSCKLKESFIWVVLAENTVSSDDPFAAIEKLPEVVSEQQQLFDKEEWLGDFNWKLYVESFIEGYHIKSTHRDSFYPYGFDNINLVECQKGVARVTYPFRRIMELDLSKEDILGSLTYVYHLHPSTIISVLSNHTTVISVVPSAANKSNVRVWKFTNRTPNLSAEQSLANAKRDSEFVSGAGFREDLDMVMSIQSALDSSANEFFTFGHFEKAISHFHRFLQQSISQAKS